MPRTCLACSSSKRKEIDKALAAGESFRNIAKRFGISPAALFRHKNHVAGTIAKAQERREERIGDGIFAGMRRVLDKGWELLNRAESEGDTRAALVALREIRASLESIDAMQSRADEAKRAEQQSQISVVVNSCIDEIKNGAEVPLAKAALPDSRDSGRDQQPTEPTPALPSSATETGSESCAIVPLRRPRPIGSIVRYLQGFR